MLFFGVIEEVFHQPFESYALFHHGLEEFPFGVIFFLFLHEELGEALDASNGVSDFMGQNGGHFA